MLERIKAQAGAINWIEMYTLGLLIVGIPAVFYVYLDLRAAFAATVTIQTVINILGLKRGGA